MTNSMKAKVCWVQEEAGGKKSLPTGPQYITAARFEEEREKWPQEAWSLVLEFNDAPDESLCIIADVRFLNPDGPKELLHSGSIFELFEGRKLVARGKVL